MEASTKDEGISRQDLGLMLLIDGILFMLLLFAAVVSAPQGMDKTLGALVYIQQRPVWLGFALLGGPFAIITDSLIEGAREEEA